jgi:hypothetical protein
MIPGSPVFVHASMVSVAGATRRGRLAGQPVGTPERLVVDDRNLHDCAAGHALVQKCSIHGQHWLVDD